MHPTLTYRPVRNPWETVATYRRVGGGHDSIHRLHNFIIAIIGINEQAELENGYFMVHSQNFDAIKIFNEEIRMYRYVSV